MGITRAVLIVLPNEILGRYVATALATHGCRALRAGSAGEALAVLAAEPEIDAVLLNPRLRDMDGGEATRAMAAARPGLRVVFTSGATYDPPPGTTFLPTPFTLSQLLTTLGVGR